MKIILLIIVTFFSSHSLLAQSRIGSNDEIRTEIIEKKAPSNKAGADMRKRVVAKQRLILKGPPQFIINGKVERGNKTKYAINGEDFELAEDADTGSSIEYGKYAQVEGYIINGRQKVGKRVLDTKREETNSHTAVGMDEPSEGDVNR